MKTLLLFMILFVISFSAYSNFCPNDECSPRDPVIEEDCPNNECPPGSISENPALKEVLFNGECTNIEEFVEKFQGAKNGFTEGYYPCSETTCCPESI